MGNKKMKKLILSLSSILFADEIKKISLPKDVITIQHKVFDTARFFCNRICPKREGWAGLYFPEKGKK